MIRYAAFGSFVWILAVSLAFGQQSGDRVELGRLTNGAAVAFARAGSGEWGIEISGSPAPPFKQPKPAEIEVYLGGDNVRNLAAGYQSVCWSSVF
jgi:hypothetical protein